MLDLNRLIVNNYLGDKSKCWICPKEPNSQFTFEEHHIVPRHLGGTEGPLVYLCSDCHKNVHDCASALLKSNSYLPYKSAKEKERCLALAQIIVKATMALKKNNKNKNYVFSTLLPWGVHEKLVELTKSLRSKNNPVNQDRVVQMAIEELHKKLLG